MPKNPAKKQLRPAGKTAAAEAAQPAKVPVEQDAANPAPRAGTCPVVGVGASAGGFEAFSEMLRELPANPGFAIVFVQHLDPKHVSVLAELLARESPIPVIEAQNGVTVARDHVYVIPRNVSVSINGGVLELAPRDVVAGQFTSIDIFLRSLAEDQGSRSVGVLLSGNASDGTLGLKAIRAAGGITIAQSPQTARFDSMPRSAIAAGWVDLILEPAEIVRELLKFAEHPCGMIAQDRKNEMLAEAADSITRVLAVVRAGTGVDFTQYKASTIRRRILRRMLLRRVETIEEYLGLIRSDAGEVGLLFEDILINVTEFFRDPATFAVLTRNIFPEIVAQRRSERNIRIWVPGCSTGEEVYSVTIGMLEAFGDQVDEIDVQVFATDVSELSLEKARAGIYPASIAQNVSQERLRRFFVKSDSDYQINKRVRELCIFARHNLAKDPPFSRIDFISCRNVLIYLGRELQEKILPMFHYALSPGGILLLGSSESTGSHSDLFQLLDKKHMIYQRKPAASRLPLEFPVTPITGERGRAQPQRGSEPLSEFDLQREADRVLLNRYAPAGVVVDEEMNILQFRGHTSPFLAPAAGTASLNLLRMLKEGLVVEVRSALTAARKANGPVRRERIHFASDGSALVNIEAIPLRRLSGASRKYLVLFEPVMDEPEPPKTKRGDREQSRVAAENQHLRLELAASKEYLQSIIEDQDAAQEELRSAAEEIQSSNEELQSTNEELEAIKEELQSMNEELNTVHEELQNRNMQLAQVGNDLLNLLANVNMPILIVGNDLRIRRFTPAAEKALNLIPSDVGRPIRDINLRITVPNIQDVLAHVADNLTPQVLEVADPDGRLYSLRIRPYRTEDNKIDGTVLVFVDVDPVMRAAEAGTGGHIVEANSSAARASLLIAQEEERRRLAHELHDELNQRLALVEFTVQSLEINKDPNEVFSRLEDLRKSVAALSEDLRRVALQLHPAIVDDLGLIPALQAYCDEFSEREGIRVRFSRHDVPGDLPSHVALTMYRIAQEALRNVAKHSGAKHASVVLSSSTNILELNVRDAGRGFHPESVITTGLGMVGMRERAALAGGTITWKSKPGEGTQVVARIPIKVPAETANSDTEKKQP